MIVVRPLARHEFEHVGRLSGRPTSPDPTELDVPELQDVFVPPVHRDRGIGTTLAGAAEELIRPRGHESASLSVSTGNPAARRLYERLGYVLATRPPKRITGTIRVRGGALEVDDTLLYFEKRLVDFPSGRSS